MTEDETTEVIGRLLSSVESVAWKVENLTHRVKALEDRAGPAGDYDLTKLTDAQLKELERLLMLATLSKKGP